MFLVKSRALQLFLPVGSWENSFFVFSGMFHRFLVAGCKSLVAGCKRISGLLHAVLVALCTGVSGMLHAAGLLIIGCLRSFNSYSGDDPVFAAGVN